MTSSPSAPLASDPFLSRLTRRLKRATVDTKRRARRLTARAVYALPLLAAHDPRRRIVRCKDYCEPVESVAEARRLGHARWYLKVRGAEVMHTQPSLTVAAEDAAAITAGIARHQGGPELRIHEVFLAAIYRAKIVGQDYLLLSDDNRLFFESALSRHDYLEANGILDRLFLPEARPLPGEFGLLANLSRGYYHWLLEVLPRLSVLEQFAEFNQLPLIVPSEPAAFHLDSLRLAGIPDHRQVRLAPGCWQPDCLYFPEMLGPLGIPSPHAVSWLRNRFLPGMEPGPRGKRRVYLTRRDARQRRVTNESEVIAMLVGHGFEVVCPGDLSFAAQVALFREIDVVVAPHGAGLTNMVFAGPGATIVEFFGDNYINGCFWALAQHCQQQHACLVGPSQWLDYEVPLAKLRTLLATLKI